MPWHSPGHRSPSMSPFPASVRQGRSRSGRPPTPCRSTCAPDAGGSDVEAEGTKLFAAVLGDLVGSPRRKPHPVDVEAGNQAFKRFGGLILDYVRERACGAGQRHVDGGHPILAEVDTVDEAEINDVDPQFRVHHITERLEDLARFRLSLPRAGRPRAGRPRAGRPGLPVRRARPPAGQVGGLLFDRVFRHDDCPAFSFSARAVASFQAIQPSSAHLIRAGYLATPAKAIASSRASSSLSSSASTSPRDRIRARKSSPMAIAPLTVFPMTRSVITEALAWLIEQPSASHDTSATTASPSAAS